MKSRPVKISAVCTLFVCSFLLLFLVRLANADRVLLSHASQYSLAASDIRRAREIRTKGIAIRVQLRDGTLRELNLPHESLGLNADENFEFYKVPTTKQILDYELYGIPLPSTDIVDPRAIEQFFAQSLLEELHAPTNAHYIVGQSNVLIADDAPGQALLMDPILARVRSIIQTLALDSINVSTTDVPAIVDTEGLEKHVSFAKLLSKTRGFLLYSGSYSWELSGSTLVPILSADTNTGNLLVDEGRLYDAIKELAHSLIEEPLIEPQFTELNGRLVVKKEGNTGHDIDVQLVANKINAWLRAQQLLFDSGKKLSNKQETASLRFTTTEPRYTLESLRKMGITELVGTATTSFKGSSVDRIHNITLGASRVSGYLVQPGEEFSLVRSIGYSEKENGYKEEYVIKGDRSRKEAGGGLCQVATTFFRAALDTGLKITERHNHRYVVGYYGPGLDAGIYAIDHDFRFINDFTTPLLVQVSVSGTVLRVEFFGHRDRRIALTTKPIITDVLPPPPPDFRFSKTIPFGKTECTDHPREGMTSYATTTIRYASGEEHVQLWKSEYSPWPKICLIGTGGLNIYQQDD